MTGEWTYSDDEVKAILSEAADRQASADTAMVFARTGMSLAEIEQIAEEAGIDPTHVRAIALRQGSKPGALVARDESGKPVIQATRHLPGTVTDETWGRMVAELRSSFGLMGFSSDYGETREWVSAEGTTSTDAIQVTLERDSDGVMLRMQKGTKSARELAWSTPLLVGVLAIVIAVLMAIGDNPNPPWIFPTLFGGMAAATAVAAPPALRKWEQIQTAQFQKTLDRIELLASRSASTEPDGE